MSDVVVRESDPLSPEAEALFEASDRDLRERYPPSSIYTISSRQAADAGAAFFIAWLDGEPVGCGAVYPLDRRIAEIKRMFVKATARRSGVGKALLTALETCARQRGFSAIRLETGPQQPEALAFYESQGYVSIPLYGEYVGDPHSLCYEKLLPVAPED